MKSILTYTRNDLRLIFRDPVLYVMFFVPILFICLLRFALPLLIEELPDLASYKMVFLASICLITAMFPAFIFSFIMLDEKDLEVLSAIRVLPVSSNSFILYRLLFICLFSLFFNMMILLLSNLTEWSLGKMLAVSIPVALISPASCLIITAFAPNKIVGTTWMKGLNFLFMIPVLTYIFTGSWEYILGILPYYWIFKIYDPGYQTFPFFINYMIGLTYIFILTFSSIILFKRRVYP
jgi:fluoroquinolone transport system permease protein